MVRRFVVLGAAFLAGSAGAQVSPPEPPQPQPPQAQPQVRPEPSPALAGPSVREQPRRVSLVEHDFNGRVRRPETTPEEAAFLLLDVPADAAEKVRAIFKRRAAVIDAFVAENLDLLNKLGTSSGKALEQVALGMEAIQKLEKLWSGGPLWEQVRGALPKDPADRFDALMREYWDALVEEGKQIPNEQGKKRGRLEVALAERAQVFFKEVEQSFLRQAESGTLFVTYLTGDLNLTESQKQRIRHMTLEFARKHGTKPSEEQQKTLFLEVVSILDPQQREKFIRKVTGN